MTAGYSEISCGATPMSRAARPGGSPAMVTWPASGAARPATIRVNVVLPAPLCPTSPVISPGATLSVNPSRAVTRPYRLTSPAASSMPATSQFLYKV